MKTWMRDHPVAALWLLWLACMLVLLVTVAVAVAMTGVLT